MPILAFAVSFACAPPLEGDLDERRVYAADLDTDYYLGIYRRPDARTGDGAPWLLVLDGDEVLPIVAQMLDREVDAGRAEPVVLVGVGRESTRERDFTTLPELEPAPEVGWGDSVGGIDPFFDWLDDTLVPELEDELDVGGDPAARGLMGHSLGGLATVYALLYRRDTWGRFGASSPSLWWDEAVPFAWEADVAIRSTDVDARVRMSVGSTEAWPMDALFDELAATLADRDYPSLALSTQVYAGYNHYAVPDAAFPDVLSTLYPASGR